MKTVWRLNGQLVIHRSSCGLRHEDPTWAPCCTTTPWAGVVQISKKPLVFVVMEKAACFSPFSGDKSLGCLFGKWVEKIRFGAKYRPVLLKNPGWIIFCHWKQTFTVLIWVFLLTSGNTNPNPLGDSACRSLYGGSMRWQSAVEI